MTRPAGCSVRNGHRPTWGNAANGNVGLQRHVENMGPRGALQVRIVFLLLRIRVRRSLDHPSEISRNTSRIRCPRHVTIDAARLIAFHPGVQFLFHVRQQIHGMAPLTEWRSRVIWIVKEKTKVGRVSVKIVAVRTRDKYSIVPIHL